MDFIIGLPVLEGYSSILVVIDKFSKQAYFGALPSCLQQWCVNFMAFPSQLFHIVTQFFLANFGQSYLL